ncbi:MAG TPA: S9 family peptidase [Chryseolinea sp.]|nr:S9 family peptidase [Chryseolinea sp.]
MRHICLFIAICVLSFNSSAQEKNHIVASDLLKITNVNQIAISPDGKQAVAIVSRKKSKEDAVKGTTEYYYTQHLFMLDVSGKTQPVQLTFGDRRDNQPVWSPDGKAIAFVRADGEFSQVWILPLTGGEAYPVTKAKHGAGLPAWSPDGKSIVYSSSVPLSAMTGVVPWSYERPGRKQNDEVNWKALSDSEKKALANSPDGNIQEVRAWLAKNNSEKNPRVLTRLNLQGELTLDTEEKFDHLFTIDAKVGAESKQITSGYQNFRGAKWSKDGKHIICSSTALSISPDYSNSSSLWRMDSDGKNLVELLKVEKRAMANPEYSPDGKSIAFVISTAEGFLVRQEDIGVVAAAGGEYTNLTKTFDRDVQTFSWSDDSKQVFFTAENEGDVPLYNVTVTGDAIPKRISPENFGVINFNARAGKIVYALAEVNNPCEVYSRDIKSNIAAKLTSFNSSWLAGKKLSQLKEYWITRPDGVRVQYWIMEPIGRKEGVKYPTILNIHGGPTAMWGPAAYTMWHEFQLEAAWGYGVVFCNPRGSGGYGDAHKRGNLKDWGNGPASDILASLDDATKQASWIDQNQLVVEGGSYAGYMVAWIIGHDNRFKAANAQRGVYDLTTFMGEGNAWRLVPDYFGGYPWDPETKKLLDSESPLTYVDKINTPLLIIHADQDLRTGVIQSEMLYKSLKIMNKPVEYVRYPGEGHELTRSGNPGRMMDHLLRVIEFFERYVTHPEPPAASTN